MSAQVTEAHRELAESVYWARETGKTGVSAQLIADSEARAIREALEEDYKESKAIETERDQLRAELEQSQSVVLATRRASIDAMNRIRALVGATDADPLSAEHYVAEAVGKLATERARLDAMVANCWVVHSEVGCSFSVFSNTCGDYIATAQTYRAAIDAAMKEGA